MRRGPRWPWLLFGLLAVAATGLLLFLSVTALQARGEARFQARLRLALFRMDSKLVPFLAREARRPPADYRPFAFIDSEARTRALSKLRKDEILVRSPLLATRPEFVRLHFEIVAGGVFGSPQVPTGNFREIAEDLAPERLAADEEVLARVRDLIDPATVDPALALAEEATQAQGAWVRQIRQAEEDATVSVGSLEPMWRGGELFFLRRVQLGEELRLQGFLADWPRLREALVGEARALLPGASLRPANDGDRKLFMLPAALDAPEPSAFTLRPWTETHTLLAVVWVVVGGAVTALGLALKRILDYGAKQRQFASRVTHELRSPLTTFALYTDLLTQGAVTDPGKLDDYYRTLHEASGQMARMVENVIAHARLEEGRARMQVEPVALGALLDRFEEGLRQRAEESGLALEVDRGDLGETTLDVDAQAVGQILLNLVENACRYGRSEARPLIRVEAIRRGDRVELRVRDFGPGVPADLARRIFLPFERGAGASTDSARGLGMGLPLSRDFARELGGDLSLERPGDGGACFVVSLPVAPA